MTAESLVKTLLTRSLKITTAESCTGGLIAAAITDISGASATFEQGVITYANSSKTALLGVETLLLDTYGAVSEQVAVAMALGAKEASRADIAISVTGIAGPSGGSAQKPVGLVFIGVAYRDIAHAKRFSFSGNRDDIRKQSVAAALMLALSTIG